LGYFDNGNYDNDRARRRRRDDHDREAAFYLVVSFKIFDLQTKDFAGDSVKVIFDYKIFAASIFSTYLESLRVKPF
jgi:hypothetical protein